MIFFPLEFLKNYRKNEFFQIFHNLKAASTLMDCKNPAIDGLIFSKDISSFHNFVNWFFFQ